MNRYASIFIAFFLLLLAPVLSFGHAPLKPHNEGKPGRPCPVGVCCPLPGAPEWQVNPINVNLYVSDTPIYYSPAVGPEVRIELSYNTMDAPVAREFFGNKWLFRYGGYLQVADTGMVTITMADGKQMNFIDDGAGSYTQDCSCDAYMVLEKVSESHFELQNKYGKRWLYTSLSADGDRLHLSEIVDIHGNDLTLGYTDDDLTTITDAMGQVTTLQYNTDGLVEKVIDPYGREALFGYDSSKNLTSLTDMVGFTTTVEYDANSTITALVNEGGRTEFYLEPATGANSWTQYPAPGAEMGKSARLTITHPDGNKEEYYYNGVNGTLWHVAPGDYREPTAAVNNFSAQVPKTIYTYANTVEGVRSKIKSITYPNGEKKIYTYDSTTGRRASVADAAGNVTSTTYNAKGQIATRTGPSVIETRYIYAANQIDLIRIEDELGAVSMTYNDKHQVVSRTDRAGSTTSYDYNLLGQISVITDPTAIETTMVYDGSNRLYQVLRDGKVVSTNTYDGIGRLATSEDATGMVVSYAYDELNHLTTVIYPDGKTESYEYGSPHSPNLQTAIIDRAGRRTDYYYSATEELVKSVSPEGGVTSYGYDPKGNLTRFTDPNSNTTGFAYDVAGRRLVERTYADGNSVTYSYNNRGLVSSKTNSRGQTTSYYYNAAGNLLTVDYSDPETPDVLLTYDAYDRLVQVEDGTGITVFTYDAASRVQAVDGPWENDTLTYSYDELNRISSIQLDNGLTRTHTYDSLGRLTTIQVDGGTFTYEYENDVSPLIARLIRPNGVETTYSYDELNRLLEVKNSDGNATILNSYVYRYNQADQRDRETVTGGLPLTPLTEGVRLSDYNSLNQLLATTNPEESFSYDADGNMVAGYTPEGYRFTASYDQENRLVSIIYTDDAGIQHETRYTYRYDSFLSLIDKLEDGVSVSTARIIRNGKLAIQERDASNTVTSEYVWGANMGGGIGGLLQLHRGTDDYYYLYDGKGNVTSVVDATGSTAAAYRYDTFGKLVAASGTLDQPFQFSTKRFDSQTGLNYYGYRFYNASIERWMNRDPLGEAGGINLYGFVQNDPVNFVDPWGLDATVWGGNNGSWLNGPTNGNWGGKCWSGGQNSCGTQGMGNAPPTDSGDECYERHDRCYDSGQPVEQCDQNLLNELQNLPDDPRQWPHPPRPGTEEDSADYRDWAIWYFN